MTRYKSPKALSVDDFTCMIYLMTFVVVKVCSYVTIASDLASGQPIHDLTDLAPQKLSLMIYAYTFLNIIFTIVPGRISRFEAISHMVSFLPLLLVYATYITVHAYTMYTRYLCALLILTYMHTLITYKLYTAPCNRDEEGVCSIRQPRAAHTA